MVNFILQLLSRHMYCATCICGEQYVNLCQRSLWMTHICPTVAMDNAERYQNSKDETELLIMPLEWNRQSQSCFSGMMAQRTGQIKAQE